MNPEQAPPPAPTPPQTSPLPPASPFNPQPAAYSAPQVPPTPSSGNKKKLMLIIGLILLLSAGAVTAFMLLKSPPEKSVDEKKATSATEETTPDVNTPQPSATKTAPAGYKQVVTPCYQISIPEKYDPKVDEYGNGEPCSVLGSSTDTGENISIGHVAAPTLTAQDISGAFAKDNPSCTAKQTKIDENIYSLEATCPSSTIKKYRKDYYLYGSDTKLGNYQGSSKQTLTLSVTAGEGSLAAVTALADDLYSKLDAR